MKIQEVKTQRKEKKSIRINLKITKSISQWMKENEISPQKVFDLALKELKNENGTTKNK